MRYGASKDKYYLESISLKSKSFASSISQAVSSNTMQGNSKQKHPYSISEWAKGETKADDDFFRSSNDDDYADVAGSYFREVSRFSHITDSISDLPDGMDPSLVIQPCIPTQQSSTSQTSGRFSNKYSRQGGQERVYLSTSILPGVHPTRPNMKRSLKVSKSKRTSSAVTDAKQPAARVASGISRAVQPLVAPKLLDDTMLVQLFAFKDMFGGRSVAETAAAGTKFRIYSNLSFRGIRTLILQYFHSTSSAPVDEKSMTEIALHYYSTETQSWRPLRHKTDWSTAKLSALGSDSPLQLTYTIIMVPANASGKGLLSGFEIPASNTSSAFAAASTASSTATSEAHSQQTSLRTRARMVFAEPSSKPSAETPEEGPATAPSTAEAVAATVTGPGAGSGPGFSDDEDDMSSVGGVSRVSVTVSVCSLQHSTDDSESAPISLPQTLGSPYRLKAGSYSQPPHKGPVPAKQAELALALEQRLMLHRK